MPMHIFEQVLPSLAPRTVTKGGATITRHPSAGVNPQPRQKTIKYNIDALGAFCSPWIRSKGILEVQAQLISAVMATLPTLFEDALCKCCQCRACVSDPQRQLERHQLFLQFARDLFQLISLFSKRYKAEPIPSGR